MPAKKNTPHGQSKAAFVRSLPPTTPAKEVVAKAKAVGIELDAGYVYNIRSTSKSSAKKKSAKAKAAASYPTNGGSAKATRDTSGTESLLKAVGAEVGLGRAIQILEAERARVRAVLRS